MSYVPYLASEIFMVRVGTKVRVLGKLEKHEGRFFLRDPFSDKRVPITKPIIQDFGDKLVEVFGTITPYGLSVDFILEANVDPRKYAEVIREEREKVLWINERLSKSPNGHISEIPPVYSRMVFKYLRGIHGSSEEGYSVSME